MTLRALIFDVDGTLAETEETHRQAFNETFAKRGLPWSWTADNYRRLLEVTGGKERIRHFIATQNPPGGPDAISAIPALHAEKTIRYAELIDAGAAAARPGVVRLVQEARAEGLKVAIATTTSQPNVVAILRAMFGPDGESLFDVIGAGDVVPRKKPAPDIFQWTLRRLNLSPAEAIALEDSANGVQAALGAGIAVVTTPSLYSIGQDFTGSLAVLSDLGEPDRPYRHLAGTGAESGWVTPAALRYWLAAA
ncbi:MAG: HAD family hydrolase [Bauldia sp.]